MLVKYINLSRINFTTPLHMSQMYATMSPTRVSKHDCDAAVTSRTQASVMAAFAAAGVATGLAVALVWQVWRDGRRREPAACQPANESQDLLNLLFSIAEEQARKG